MVNGKKISTLVVSWTLLILLVFTQSSCETLRKKFTRKKKDSKKQELIPVLEPVDYAATAQSPEKRYSFNYSLWKVWQKDLVRAINEGDNNKSLQYMLNQIVNQLKEMQQLSDKKARFDEIIGEYRELEDDFAQSAAMRNSYLLALTVERIGKKVRHDLNPNSFSTAGAEVITP